MEGNIGSSRLEEEEETMRARTNPIFMFRSLEQAEVRLFSKPQLRRYYDFR